MTVTMIVGLLVVVTLFVIKFRDLSPLLPEQITLPKGVKAQSYGQGSSWISIITNDDRILIFDRSTGGLVQEIAIRNAP